MRLTRMALACAMTLRELARSRIVLLLLVTVPTVFDVLVALTSSSREVPFPLASLGDDVMATASERNVSLVFVGLGAVGLLTSFVGMTFVQKNADATRRLVLAGFRAEELVLARLGALGAVVVVVALYGTVMLLAFFRPAHVVGLFASFALGGFVYGAWGLLVGALVRRELEGILCVTLLANVDAGWLQNPLAYTGADHKVIIRALPAYFPSQAAFVAAFSDRDASRALVASSAYGALFLLLAVAAFWRRTRVVHSRPCSRSLL